LGDCILLGNCLFWVTFWNYWNSPNYYSTYFRDKKLRFSFDKKRFALVAWHGGHRVRQQNRRSRVPIPPGRKVFRYYT
jgi:hypothetical protein